MATARTREMWREAVAAIHPDDEMRQVRAVESAINPDGTFKVGALDDVLPWQRVDWYLSGFVGAGMSNLGAEFRMPQRVRVRRIDIRSKSTPESAFTLNVVNVSGEIAVVTNVSIQAGNRTGVSGGSAELEPGALLRLDCIAGSGRDISVSLFYSTVLE